ncbi:MAG: hypothetical protein K2W95_10250 [Candidatus Obscuribacterales bacterium]|nr:hypothetical protein [Candidatus Obscuribacterales bacterium]
MNTAFAVFGAMVANFGALMVGFVVAQVLVCVASSRQNPKALLHLVVGPIALSPWFALIAVAGGAFFAGSPEDAGLCVVVSGVLGMCFAFLGNE